MSALLVYAVAFAFLTVQDRAGRVLTREQLLDLARGGTEEAFGRSIDVTISRLRQKLGDDARKPRWLKTIRGAGYMLAAESGESRRRVRKSNSRKKRLRNSNRRICRELDGFSRSEPRGRGLPIELRWLTYRKR